MDAISIVVVSTISLILAYIQYKGSRYNPEKSETANNGTKNPPFFWEFSEIWSRFVTSFIGGMTVLYFVTIRWQDFKKSAQPGLSDFVLIIIIGMTLMGYFGHFLKNITISIGTILSRLLERK